MEIRSGSRRAHRSATRIGVMMAAALMALTLAPVGQVGGQGQVADGWTDTVYAQPAGCGSGPAGEGQVYLGAWIPAAHDDPRLPRSDDPLGQFEAKAGKGVSVL